LNKYGECWVRVASALFSQALAGAPEFAEAVPRPVAGDLFGLTFTLCGEEEGNFSVSLDCTVLDQPLVGENVDQKAGWVELLREISDAAAGELLAKTGRKCQVAAVGESSPRSRTSRVFELRSGGEAWTILIDDETHPQPAAAPAPRQDAAKEESTKAIAPSHELLLDIELEATLRFGCRELPLNEILNLGPGDVVELDRQVADPVDLVVGDKIVARGEVVLVNGSFALRVTEVVAPRKRLESIRCLF
jgi:flagellar motor switch protein FliN